MKTLHTTRSVSDKDKQMLLALKDVILAHDPEAEVILYGSTARGTRETDSDYDVLVITSRELTADEEEALDSGVYDLQLESGAILSVITYPRQHWLDPRMKGSPYRANVIGEGIAL